MLHSAHHCRVSWHADRKEMCSLGLIDFLPFAEVKLRQEVGITERDLDLRARYCFLPL